MKKERFKSGNFPTTPGVYLMKGAKGDVLYVGKAGNLRRRVSSYFSRPQEYRIEKMLSEVKKIDYEKTETAIEALILESRLIKSYQPPYNVLEKDDKSFLFVEITNEKFPRVLLVRGTEPEKGKRYGPFTSATSIRYAMDKIIRRIFPLNNHVPEKIGTYTRPCLNYEIGLCPGTCVGAISEKDYKKNIRHVRLFLEGKKKELIRELGVEMRRSSKTLEFENAEQLQRQIFSLQHIQDIALIGDTNHDSRITNHELRIEGYDVSNISGTFAVGSMVVFSGNQPDKNQYRKFKIQTIKQADDTGMMREMLERRFSHDGWPLPGLVLVDGGLGQVNTARKVLNEKGLRIPVVGIAKGPERKRNDMIGLLQRDISKLGLTINDLIQVRDEAHRFAVKYHTYLRGKGMIGRE